MSSHACLVSCTVRVCAAFLLRVSVAVLLELTELAKPVERPCLCCDTHTHTGLPRRRAEMRSAASHESSAWLQAKPCTADLCLEDPAFQAAVRRRLGISTLPLPHASTSCQCGKQAASLGPEHALTCPSPQKLRTDRHDRIVAVLCDALLRAGIEHSKEPHLSAFADRTAGPGAHVQARRAARAVGESRGDILFHLRDRPTVLDVSVVTASAATYCAAAAHTDGAAAAARDAEKHATYARRADTCLLYTSPSPRD